MKNRFIVKFVAFLICLFLIVPVFVIIPMSFGSSQYLEFPPRGFSTQWYEKFFNDTGWVEALMYSLKIAVLSTVCALVLGVTASEGLTRCEFRGKGILQQIFQLPMIIPVIVIAIALYKFETQTSLRGSTIGLVAAHTLMGLPYVISTVYSRRVSVDKNLAFASYNLGATPVYTMFKITIPLIKPALLSGGLFAFATSFDELVISMFLCSTRSATLPKMIWDGVRSEIDPTITSIASILIVTVSLIMLASGIMEYKAENVKTVKGEV